MKLTCPRCGVVFPVAPPHKYRKRGKTMPVLCRDCRPWVCRRGHDQNEHRKPGGKNCRACERVRYRESIKQESN